MPRHDPHSKLTLAGLIITIGIIYGDIGTSPLYVYKAIIDNSIINKDLVIGGLSCIFWTLTLQTTVKYVILTLRADNKGEGGIFSLYALVRKTKVKWLVFPAIVGGCALLADGLITPSISVASAVDFVRRSWQSSRRPIPICVSWWWFPPGYAVSARSGACADRRSGSARGGRRS